VKICRNGGIDESEVARLWPEGTRLSLLARMTSGDEEYEFLFDSENTDRLETVIRVRPDRKDSVYDDLATISDACSVKIYILSSEGAIAWLDRTSISSAILGGQAVPAYLWIASAVPVACGYEESLPQSAEEGETVDEGSLPTSCEEGDHVDDRALPTSCEGKTDGGNGDDGGADEDDKNEKEGEIESGNILSSIPPLKFMSFASLFSVDIRRMSELEGDDLDRLIETTKKVKYDMLALIVRATNASGVDAEYRRVIERKDHENGPADFVQTTAFYDAHGTKYSGGEDPKDVIESTITEYNCDVGIFFVLRRGNYEELGFVEEPGYEFLGDSIALGDVFAVYTWND